MAVAIVAIPVANEYVWKISSEKVPHLTLLMLGDKLDNPSQVEGFIDHVVQTSLSAFCLRVSRRGVLGDKSADVLFFDNYYVKMIADFRQYLLANNDIRRAYDSVDQYPVWTPHLTLGFPETPAKPDNREYPGIPSVNFDRIALWTGDYEGVEFPLKNDSDVALSMTTTRGEAFLEHYGVKGMKWGVIRDKIHGNAAVKLASASEDHKRVKTVRTKAKVVGVQSLSNKELQDVITRMNLEVSYKSLKTVEHEQSLLGMGKKWAGNFVTDVLKDAASSWLKRPGSNTSGRTTARGRAWVGGQPVINGHVVTKAIGN